MTIVALIALASPISILARGAAGALAPRATRLQPRSEAAGGAAGRTDEPAADKLDEQSLGAERVAVLDALVKQLDAGAPFSLEEARLLRRYQAGARLATVQADVIISRALYAAYVSRAVLTDAQAKILERYRELSSHAETGILDEKERVLEAEAGAASERSSASEPANDRAGAAEVLSPGPFPVRSTLIADVRGVRGDDAAPVGTAAGEPVSHVTWYAFTPEQSGRYRISTSREDGNLTTIDDTILAVSTVDASGGVHMLPTTATTDGFDDDSAADGDLQAALSTALEAGTRYLIAAGKRGASAPVNGRSSLQISIDLEKVDRVLAADTCAGATALVLNTPVNDTTVGATNDYQLASGSACFTANGAIQNVPDVLAGPDVVYTFTAPATGTYSIRVQPTNTAQSYDVALYTSSVCPTGTGVQTVSCLTAADRRGDNGGDEIKCQSLTAGQQIFVFVDGFRASGTGSAGSFELEVVNCVNETESNDTPATANALACGQEGSLIPITDVDFFSLGTPATGSRVFAIVDGGPSAADDYDLRVTTATTTLEYDDLNNVFPFGANGPNVAGTPTTGVATYLRVNYFSQTSPAAGVEPYRIVSVIQPPIASATTETEPNDTPATASSGANNYFSGTLTGTTDSTDLYAFPATAGDLVYLGLDGDPLRNNTPINGALALLDGSGTLLISVNDGGSTSSTTAGASLTSTTPSSPGEGLLYRVRTTGTYYARVTGSTTAVTGDYLLSISKNCQTGGGVAPAPTITIDDVTQNEGNAGTTSFTFSVSLSAPSASTVTVNYATADGTATAPSDYTAKSGTLTFSPGVTTQQITVLVNGDTTTEPNETFFVNLTSPTNATIADSQGLGTIVNDDASTISINDVTQNEGNSGTTSFAFSVSLSAPSASTITVNYATADGTATAPSDYTTTSGTLTFAPSVTTQQITVSVNGDTALEPNETFFVNLTSPTNATIADSQGLGTIVNDDAATADLATTITDAPDPVAAGSNLTYTITETNNGPDAATSTSVILPLPAGTTFVSATAPGGWSATTPAVGSNGTVTFTNPSFAVGSATFTVVASVPCSTTGVLSATATSSSATSDPTAGNNAATATTTVTNPAPAVSCPANVTTPAVAGACSAVVSYTTPTATDGSGCAATVSCVPASGSTFPVGTTTVTCTATDAANQTGTCSFTVTVTDAQAPTLTCPANITTGTANGQCSAAVTYATPTASDNCSSATVSCLPASGSTFPKGTTTVTCTATDASNNTGSCTFTVTVNDTQPPSIACPANVTVANSPNLCGATVTYPAPTASDNCSGVTLVCLPASGSTFPKGTTTVTCTATDASANTASCTFTVTVNDTQAPAITCPANVTTPATTTQGAQTGANVTYGAPSVSDNCPGVGAPVCTPASGTFFATGTTTVTCTVTDASANSASCSFTVTVSGGFTNCFVDDATGDVLSINTDPSSPLYRMWQYRVAATGQIVSGSAEGLSYIPNRSLVAYDRDNATARMELTVNYASKTATATVTTYGAGGRTYTLRDRNTANDPACR